jgi:hypothetical protein
VVDNRAMCPTAVRALRRSGRTAERADSSLRACEIRGEATAAGRTMHVMIAGDTGPDHERPSPTLRGETHWGPEAAAVSRMRGSKAGRRLRMGDGLMELGRCGEGDEVKAARKARSPGPAS